MSTVGLFVRHERLSVDRGCPSVEHGRLSPRTRLTFADGGDLSVRRGGPTVCHGGLEGCHGSLEVESDVSFVSHDDSFAVGGGLSVRHDDSSAVHSKTLATRPVGAVHGDGLVVDGGVFTVVPDGLTARRSEASADGGCLAVLRG